MPSIQLKNGLNMCYRESGAGDRVWLFIHGNVASSRWWEKVMAELPAGVRAVAPDLRGCGDSDKPDGHWSMADLGDDVYQFTQALGIRRAAVIGHSLGGSVALQLAVDHPDLISHLVVINSAPADGLQLPEASYAQVEQFAKSPDITKAALGMMMPTAPKDQLYAQLLDDGVKSAGAWLRNGYALRDMNLVAQAAALKVPALVLYGKQDALVTSEMAERTQAQIPGALLEMWPEIGHSAPVEAPQQLVQRIAAFAK